MSRRQRTRNKAVWGSRAVPRPGKGRTTRSKVTWGARIVAMSLAFACAFAATAAAQTPRFPKMDRSLEQRAAAASKSHKTTVFVTLDTGTDLPADLQKFSRFGRLNAIEAHVLDIPDDQLKYVATLPQTVHVH